LTDKKFSGHPIKSYGSQHPFKVVGEVTACQGHSTEQVKETKEGVARSKEQCIEAL
jgi:hypothetical protein